MLYDIILLLIGLYVLIKGSDFFVRSSAVIAKRFGVSEFVIGLTLVAIGTSIPELASSLFAIYKGNPGIVIGNAIGSNIANIGLVIGIAALFGVLKTNSLMLKRDGYFMMLSAVIFVIFMTDNTIAWYEAVMLLLLYVVYLLFLTDTDRYDVKDFRFKSFVSYFFRFGYIDTVKNKIEKHNGTRKAMISEDAAADPSAGPVPILVQHGLTRDIILLIIGLAMVIAGGFVLVEQAIKIAEGFNVPAGLIGLTIIAVGTSLPELMVSVSAARKGFGDIAVGNVIGSNIANILLIIGAAGLFRNLSIDLTMLYVSIPFLILMSAVFLIIIRSRWEIRKSEGIIFILLYIAFISLSIMNA